MIPFLTLFVTHIWLSWKLSEIFLKIESNYLEIWLKFSLKLRKKLLKIVCNSPTRGMKFFQKLGEFFFKIMWYFIKNGKWNSL